MKKKNYYINLPLYFLSRKF